MGGMPTLKILEKEKLGWCGKYTIVANCIIKKKKIWFWDMRSELDILAWSGRR